MGSNKHNHRLGRPCLQGSQWTASWRYYWIGVLQRRRLLKRHLRAFCHCADCQELRNPLTSPECCDQHLRGRKDEGNSAVRQRRANLYYSLTGTDQKIETNSGSTGPTIAQKYPYDVWIDWTKETSAERALQVSSTGELIISFTPSTDKPIPRGTLQVVLPAGFSIATGVFPSAV